MTGSFTYDSETPDQAGGWNQEDYGGYWLNSFSMSVGNYTFTHNPEAAEEPYFYISVGNGGFYYDIGSGYSAFYGPCFMYIKKMIISYLLFLAHVWTIYFQ